MAPLHTESRWQRRAALLLMVASGFAGLGYQIVWTQQGALWLGHESAGVLAVVTAFFGGLAVGALLLGARIEHSRHAVRWYVSCECLIATWSLLLAMIMPTVSNWLLQLTGVQPAPLWQWTVAFVGTFCLLLPATAAMGATLPAMERLTHRVQIEHRCIAALYASNTLGAVLGVLAIAFWLVPAIGLMRTALICAALNIVCASSSLYLFKSIAKLDAPPVTPKVIGASRLLVRLVFTGLLGIGYEVLVVRVLSQVTEDTVYTFAMLLAVYLVGSALGAAGYQRWLAKHAAAKRMDDVLLCALSGACLLGTINLWFAEDLRSFVIARLGVSMSAAITAESILALVAFGPPTLVMGALFSHLCARATASGISFGHTLGVNTLGATAAPLVFGVLAMPLLGPKFSLLLIAAGYLVLIPWRSWLTPLWGIPAAIVIALAIWAPPLRFIEVPQGGHVVSYKEGFMASVSVVEDADGIARLRIDNRQQEGSSATLRVDARQALLPILLHPAPKQALFLGLGTGVTASSAAQFPDLQVDAVELLPEVITASAYFTQAVVDAGTPPSLNLIAADARRYVRTSSKHYDVIVSDNFHPARSGSGSLYTVEHFAAVRERLNIHGVFCQWLPLHQLDLDTLRSIIRSFLTVYPDGLAMLASNSLETPVLGLVARNDAEHFALEASSDHLITVSLPPRLANIGIEDEFALLGSFVAGPQSLHEFAADAALNTDDRPVVAYRAPRITYAPDSAPRDRLVNLLEALSIEPEQLIGNATDAVATRRLAAYWRARDLFIKAGRDVRPSADVQHMLAQVREPLLLVLHTSPDFRPAYDPLLRMAVQQMRTDAHDARALLMELARIQPKRTEAEAALQQVDAAH